MQCLALNNNSNLLEIPWAAALGVGNLFFDKKLSSQAVKLFDYIVKPLNERPATALEVIYNYIVSTKSTNLLPHFNKIVKCFYPYDAGSSVMYNLLKKEELDFKQKHFKSDFAKKYLDKPKEIPNLYDVQISSYFYIPQEYDALITGENQNFIDYKSFCLETDELELYKKNLIKFIDKVAAVDDLLEEFRKLAKTMQSTLDSTSACLRARGSITMDIDYLVNTLLNHNISKPDLIDWKNWASKISHKVKPENNYLINEYYKSQKLKDLSDCYVILCYNKWNNEFNTPIFSILNMRNQKTIPANATKRTVFSTNVEDVSEVYFNKQQALYRIQKDYKNQYNYIPFVANYKNGILQEIFLESSNDIWFSGLDADADIVQEKRKLSTCVNAYIEKRKIEYVLQNSSSPLVGEKSKKFKI